MLEDEKHEADDNAQTIRPPSMSGRLPASAPPSGDISSIIEDYSDLAAEEDDNWLEDKVADFKVRMLHNTKFPLFLTTFVDEDGFSPWSVPSKRHKNNRTSLCFSWTSICPTLGTTNTEALPTAIDSSHFKAIIELVFFAVTFAVCIISRFYRKSGRHPHSVQFQRIREVHGGAR